MVYFIKGIAVSSVSKCLQKDEHKKFRTQAQNNRRHLLSASQPFQRGFKNPFTENSVSPPTGTKYSEGHIVMHRLGSHSLLASQTWMREHEPLFFLCCCFFLMCAMLLLTRLAVFLN